MQGLRRCVGLPVDQQVASARDRELANRREGRQRRELGGTIRANRRGDLVPPFQELLDQVEGDEATRTRDRHRRSLWLRHFCAQSRLMIWRCRATRQSISRAVCACALASPLPLTSGQPGRCITRGWTSATHRSQGIWRSVSRRAAKPRHDLALKWRLRRSSLRRLVLRRLR